MNSVGRTAGALIFVFMVTATWAQAAAVYNRITKDGVVRVGVPYNRTPQGFITNDGEWVGFDVDFADELAKHMNLKIEKVKVNDKTWKEMLAKGQIDAALSRITHTRSLDHQFDFSEPYFYDALSVMANKGTFKSSQDLKGFKIAAVQGSKAEKLAMKGLRAAGDENAERNVVSYPDRASCFLALGRDKVAAWVDSGMALLDYAAKSPSKYELISVSDDVEPVAVVLPQDDSAWRDLVNFTIQDMAADGSFKKIYQKWFGPETHFHFPLRRSLEIWPE